MNAETGTTADNAAAKRRWLPSIAAVTGRAKVEYLVTSWKNMIFVNYYCAYFLHCWWAKNACRITSTRPYIVLGTSSSVAPKCISPELQHLFCRSSLEQAEGWENPFYSYLVMYHTGRSMRRERRKVGKKCCKYSFVFLPLNLSLL